MRLEQLRYFMEVARVGTYLKAAENLYVSQPSISHAIKKMEETLNVKLFERSRQGATLTDIGQLILPRVQLVLNTIEEISEIAKVEEDVLAGELSIATTQSMGKFVTKALLSFKEKYPLVNIEIIEDGTNNIIKGIKKNHYDIGICSHRPNEQFDGIHFEHLFSGRLLVCVGSNVQFTISNPLPIDIISKQPLVMFKRSYRNYEYLKNILNNDQELNILLSSGNTEIAKKVISSGIGIGFYPDFYIKNDEAVKNGDIIPLEIENNKEEIYFGWIRSEKQHFSTVAKEFVKTLETIVQKNNT